MHYKIIVVKPREIGLDTLMYKFEEIDKNQIDSMADERCVFIKQLNEIDIPLFLTKIYEYYSMRKKECLEKITYRVNHSLNEYTKHYGETFSPYIWSNYLRYVDVLNEYEIVKDLECDDLRQIRFIKENSIYVKWDEHTIYTHIYIKNIGYGYFDNPYAIFDYYQVATEEWYHHLKKINGESTNYCLLNDLDVDGTLAKLDNDDYYSYIIFCKDNVDDARVYAHDEYGFNKFRGNEECFVEDTGEILKSIQKQYGEYMKYEVMLLDIHS